MASRMLFSALVRVSPESYDTVIDIYKNPFVNLMEIGLVGAVLFHALNGLRIAIIDYKPVWWKYQQRAALYVLGGTVIILVTSNEERLLPTIRSRCQRVAFTPLTDREMERLQLERHATCPRWNYTIRPRQTAVAPT